jgi:hypothetical protein
MIEAMRPFRAAFIVLSTHLADCSSESTKMPPTLGDCVPTPAATCSLTASGAGGATGGGPNTGTGDDASDTMTSCGTADSEVGGLATCAPCIQANCCAEDSACSGDCFALLGCTEGCPAGDTICVGACENMFPAGFSAYRVFVQCVSVCSDCVKPQQQ